MSGGGGDLFNFKGRDNKNMKSVLHFGLRPE